MQGKVWWNKDYWGYCLFSIMTISIQQIKRNSSVMVCTELYEETVTNKYHKTCHKSIVLKIY